MKLTMPTARVFAMVVCAATAFSTPVLAQTDAAEEARMQELGESFESAWALYQHLKQEAGGGTQEPDVTALPDWSGLWERETGPFFFDPEQTDFDAPPPVELTPEYQQEFDERMERYAQGDDFDPISVCGVPASHPRFLVEPFMREFVPKPDQTWLINEAGNEIRRIYTDGRGHVPEEASYPLYEGDSIGFWDGNRLIVHTNDLQGTILQRIQPQYSNAAETVEIWEKVDNETMRVDLWIYDPQAFEKPWYSKQVYKKIPNEDGLLRIRFWACAENPNNEITLTDEGGSSHTDLTFTDKDDDAKEKDQQ